MNFKKITKREIEVAIYITSGLNNTEIAKLLGITTHAIKVHATKLFKKINAKNRVNAAYLIGSNKELNNFIFKSSQSK